MSVLIVEDDADLLEIFSYTLRLGGHTVIEALDGASGIQI